MVTWKAGNVGQYEPCVNDVTGLIGRAEYYAKTTLSGVPTMVMPRSKPMAVHYVMLVNPFATNVVKTTQIRNWWCEEIARIDPAQRNLDPPHAYISVVNESSE